jgi:hypothetical protein
MRDEMVLLRGTNCVLYFGVMSHWWLLAKYILPFPGAKKSPFNTPSVCRETYEHWTQDNGWESRRFSQHGSENLKINGTYFVSEEANFGHPYSEFTLKYFFFLQHIARYGTATFWCNCLSCDHQRRGTACTFPNLIANCVVIVVNCVIVVNFVVIVVNCVLVNCVVLLCSCKLCSSRCVILVVLLLLIVLVLFLLIVLFCCDLVICVLVVNFVLFLIVFLLLLVFLLIVLFLCCSVMFLLIVLFLLLIVLFCC